MRHNLAMRTRLQEWSDRLETVREASDLGFAPGDWPLYHRDEEGILWARENRIQEHGHFCGYVYVAPGRSMAVLND